MTDLAQKLEDLRLSMVSNLVNINNFNKILHDIIPDDTIVGRINKVTKEDIINTYISSTCKLCDINRELIDIIRELNNQR